MALPLTVEKLEEVEENLRPLYAERDGKFRLQVDGAIEDPTDWQRRVQAANKESAERRKQLESWKALGKTPEELAELITQADEISKRISDAEEADSARKGEWEKLKAQMNDRHASELKRLQEEIGKRDSAVVSANKALEDHLIASEVTAAIAAAKGDLELLHPHVLKNVRIETTDEGLRRIYVVDDKGDRRAGSKGDLMTVAEMVAEMRGTDKFGRLFDGDGARGSGTPPAANGSGRAGLNKKRSDFKTERERADFVDRHGIDAYMKLPA